MLKSTGQFGRWFWNKMILNLVILEHHGKETHQKNRAPLGGRLMWILPKRRYSSRFWTLVVMEALTGRTDATTRKWWMNILKLGKRHPCEVRNQVARNVSSEISEYSQICFGHATLFRDVLGAFQWQRYLQEFISGCLRLQGAARAVDLLLMTKDTRRGSHWMLGNMKWSSAIGSLNMYVCMIEHDICVYIFFTSHSTLYCHIISDTICIICCICLIPNPFIQQMSRLPQWYFFIISCESFAPLRWTGRCSRETAATPVLHCPGFEQILCYLEELTQRFQETEDGDRAGDHVVPCTVRYWAHICLYICLLWPEFFLQPVGTFLEFTRTLVCESCPCHANFKIS